MSVSTDSDFKWTAKGDWQTSVYRNLLRDHIKAGGRGDDLVGIQIISKFVNAVILSSDFRDLVSLHRFNAKDIRDVVSSAISAGLEGQLPSPFIQDGFPRVLGCILIENKTAITSIMRMVNETQMRHIQAITDAHGHNLNPKECRVLGRFSAISEASVEVGRFNYDYITQKNGPAQVTIKINGQGLLTADAPGRGCGCAPLLLFGGMVLSTGAFITAVLSMLINGTLR
jgi:hypothetical protein